MPLIPTILQISHPSTASKLLHYRSTQLIQSLFSLALARESRAMSKALNFFGPIPSMLLLIQPSSPPNLQPDFSTLVDHFPTVRSSAYFRHQPQ